MNNDADFYAPPDDLNFQMLVVKASRGEIPVFGAVIETEKVTLLRAYESHHPENMSGGQEIVQSMMTAWQHGESIQPWLYVKDGKYIVADDYFWLALIEMGKPVSFSAQVLGEPLSNGLIEKVGPLGLSYIHNIFGKL